MSGEPLDTAGPPGGSAGDASRFGTTAFYAAIGRAFVVMCAVVPVLALIELIDKLSHGQLVRHGGIRPHQVDGLGGIFLAPLLHVGWPHLLANSVPLILLGTFVLAAGARRFLLATLIIVVSSGLGVWFTTPARYLVVGASGVIFGWMGYLLSRGIVEHRLWNITVSVLVALLYGWQMIGVLPAEGDVSWQGHLFGFIGGLIAAVIVPRQRAATG